MDARSALFDLYGDHLRARDDEFRGQVLAQVEGGLARGETPHPRNARVLQSGF